MNKKYFKYYLILSFGLFFSATGQLLAQSFGNEKINLETESICEHITLFTDRDIYAIHEQIRFSGIYRKGNALQGKTWSTVMYVELVSPTGLSLVSGKFSLEDNVSSGSLSIPANAVTGNYFLRGYTKWMRNFGPQSFSYVPVKIINPFSQEVLETRSNGSDLNDNLKGNGINSIRCITDKKRYAPGDEVRMELILQDPGFESTGKYCLTVFPAGLGDTLPDRMIMNVTSRCDEFMFDHLPDIRGVSISGQVVNAADQSPSSYATVHFSVMGDQSDYFASMADDQGLFVMNLPDRMGRYELFVASESAGDIRNTILVDQDFSTDPVPFYLPAFSLSEEEQSAISRMAINMQLSTVYGISNAENAPEIDTNAQIPFYGIPGLTILTRDFVDLPNMTEVFENLVVDVHVRTRRGEPYFQIASPNYNIGNYPPLLLVDNIPVFDVRTFLSIDPLKIKKIDVITDVFVRGNMKWGGIIILTSREGDMAGVNLPEGSYFIDYQAYQPDLDEAEVINSESMNRMPDTRNTLLWVDDLNLKTGEVRNVKFNTALTRGEYHILVRGVSETGKIIFGTNKFIVD